MTAGLPLVGILGGMGPAATAEFYAKLIARTPAGRDQDHLRVAIWADPTVPDRVAAVLDGSTDPYPQILSGALKLRDLGATVIAIPCHTAHFFLPNLIEDTATPFVDMVAETASALVGHTGPIALLGTRGTLATGLYQSRLHDLDVVLPSEPAQQEVDRAIAAVKRADPQGAATHLDNALSALNASLTVLACTELPLAARYATTDTELLDPMDLLADAVIRACK
ncbi:aspartate/glutamate racemase family protein [Nocardia alni]|uniref:aspartate/glutamate racemase family protein n=1 Tax=Nocardia alni TaxID=2815723 RepID=UPI001C23BAF7|nr:amino acid racemase [Nocardia alni]